MKHASRAWCLVGLWLTACGGSTELPDAADAGTSAPEPPLVPPEVPVTGEIDRDANKIDDRLDEKLKDLRSKLASHDATVRSNARAELDESIRVECIFASPVTTQSVERFEAAGGSIRHVFRAVSYGWVGSLPREKVEQVARTIGGDLVLLQGDREYAEHLDEATRVGRVRPIWASGFAGDIAGFSGAANVTIAILDSGVDGSHTDLTGRMAYWHDYTAAAAANAVDHDGHGTHVAGIAVGSGAALGVGPGVLRYTDSGDLTGDPGGAFAPSPIHLPTVPLTFNSVATWLGGSSAALHLVSRPEGASTFPVLDSAGGPSPLGRNHSFTPLAGQQFLSVLLQSGPITRYGVANMVTNYPAVGDGFNILRGVAPACQWIGARVVSGGVALASDLSMALDDMIAKRASMNIKIANISLGGDAGQSDPGARAKVNTMVANGILVVVSAGNAGPNGIVGDPGRASRVLTVGASNDQNELAYYSSAGFFDPLADEDNKPDLLAPGGSGYRSMILAPDSNSSDAALSTFGDLQENDYSNRQGTSMAAPFAAGAGALVIDALQRAGLAWNFGSTAHPLLVKMLLSASATETNANREAGRGNNPTLGRTVAKDLLEGYGLVNPDAAVEAATLELAPGSIMATTTGTRADRRAWGRKLVAAAGTTWTFNLLVPSGGDYDLYLYAGAPDTKGNPVVLASSAHPGLGAAESVSRTASVAETDYLFIKRVSGSGVFSLGATNRPCGNLIVESGEQCDDGNLVDGDCCSSLCQLEPTGSSCNDGLPCTQSDTCQAGTCVGSSPVTCTASDVCHDVGTCDPATGACTNPAAMNGKLCDDGSLCTQSDTCQAGTCVGSSPVTCAASDVCHAVGTCDPTTGACSNPAATNGKLCDDGSLCTQSDTCQAGTCVGSSPVTCSASDACHAVGVCNPATGACSNPTAADGTGCNDGDVCTQSDACQGGACVGSAFKLCPAADECHAVGVCISPTGACSVVPLADGIPCPGGACLSGVCVPIVDAGSDAAPPQDAAPTFDAAVIDVAPRMDASTLEGGPNEDRREPSDVTTEDSSLFDVASDTRTPGLEGGADAREAAPFDAPATADARAADAPADRPTEDVGALADATGAIDVSPADGAAGTHLDASASDASPGSSTTGVAPTIEVGDSGGGCGCRLFGPASRPSPRVPLAFALIALAVARRRRAISDRRAE